jgi:hypothetical protein
MCPDCGGKGVRRLGNLECGACGRWLPDGGAPPVDRGSVASLTAPAIRDAVDRHLARGDVSTSILVAERPQRNDEERARVAKAVFLLAYLVWSVVGKGILVTSAGYSGWQVYLGLAIMTLIDLAIRYTALFIDWRVFKQVAIGLATVSAIMLGVRHYGAPLSTNSQLEQVWPLVDLLLLGWFVYLLWADLRKN